jgi:hypothetical protein
MGITAIQREPEIRKKILGIEKAMFKLPNVLIGDSPEYLAVCPLKHTFVDGAYVREIFLPKGMIFVTKIHKKTHPYFILKGDVSVLTEEGPKRIKGPLQGITKAGTKRVIYTHEDTVWITVHVTNETDLKKIEEEVIAKSFDEIDKCIDVVGENISEEELVDFMEQVSKQEEEVC